MLRNISIRNNALLRVTFNRAAAIRVGTRAISTHLATRNELLFRTPKHQIQRPLAEVWSTNFVRSYADYPSHIKVLLPALSPTMDQGTIVSWEKKEGDKLNEGDLLAEIETDKATMGFETPEEGYLAKILIASGTKDVAVGKLVCIIVEEESSVAAFKDFKDDGSAAPAPKKAAEPTPLTEVAPIASAASPPPSPPSTPAPDRPLIAVEQRGERVYASPMAKRLAEAQSIRLEGRGSGIYGSLKSTDLADLPASGAAPGAAPVPVAPQGGYIDIPVSNVRGVIAKRLTESKQNIPHYYVTVECQVDNVVKLRANVNKKYEKKGVKVSLNDFVIKATAAACRKVPAANSQWHNTYIRQFDNVDVSIAVSTESGLITPIIFSADRKGVVDISTEMKSLAAKARENKLKPQEFQGGTVCISNLGMFGVQHFSAVINPPQACILAVGTTSKKLVIDENNIKGFREVTVMNVTLSADHRVIDGAVAAQWLQHFREFIEDPQTMIL